jgi:hypothetical protein
VIEGITKDPTGRFGAVHAVTSFSYQGSIGGGAARWTMELKTQEPDFFRFGLMDDDWVDVELLKHARRYHVVRGPIDSIREQNSPADGATSRTFIVSGRNHAKPFERTPIFFNRYLGENVGGGAALRAFLNSADGAALFGTPDQTVRTFLFEFLDYLGQRSNARWVLPPGMGRFPTIEVEPFPTRLFVEHCPFQTEWFFNDPERIAVRPMFIDTNGFSGQTLWDLAKEWSDPTFTELYADLTLPNGEAPAAGEEFPIGRSVMSVVYRNKPFPTQAATNYTLSGSPWFFLPVHEVTTDELGSTEWGRGGDERYNYFSVRMSDEAAFGSTVDLTRFLWDTSDIVKRGILKMEATTQYASPTSANYAMITQMQELLRDWYGLNGYFQSGTVPLQRLRPDIRVGTRIVIPGSAPEKDRHFYVEGVNHSWQLGVGRTSLMVTRGWIGTDQHFMRAIRAIPNRFSRVLDVQSLDTDGTNVGFA